MYNKILADLIKQKINEDLEKIKLELFEDDNYSADIQDSIDVVRKEMGLEHEDVPVINTLEKEKLVKHAEVPKEVVSDSPSIVQEVNLQPIVTNVATNENSITSNQPSQEKTIQYDHVKLSAAVIALLAFGASMYFLFIR